ncbi:Mechanosensitive ion channel-domain-containing protein [Tirmania nivea]|nr:Mechanosensitive ion channel-domain-containing protein [Tirmania nivea]
MAGDSTSLNSTESQNHLQGRPDDHVVYVPLSHIRSHVSERSRGGDGDIALHTEMLMEQTGLGQRSLGRRRIRGPGDGVGDPASLNKLGRFYEKLINFSVVTRYLIYIFPLSLVLAIPTLVGGFGPGKDVEIGGVRMVWFFLWIQIIWVSLWVSKLAAKALPYIFMALVGVVSSGVKKYATVIRALELPISLVGWTITCLTTFTPIMTRNLDKVRSGDTGVKPWQVRMNAILGACVVSSLVYLGQKVLVHMVSVNYHRKQFEGRIQENKQAVKLLAHLYEASRRLFPDYTEFQEEDTLIHQGMAGALLTPASMGKNGASTPMRHMIGNLNVVGNKVTSAFGNVAREVTGKNVFNPNSAYSVVLEGLHRKDSSEALARRIWMSFVAEDSDGLKKEDLVEVMGLGQKDIALECFAMLDKDDNGDVSLEEMIMVVLLIHRERKDVAKSMQDVDNAISVLDSLLGTLVFIIVIFVFVAFNFNNFSTMLAAAGTMLLSLSFVFAITAQEVLGSCIFLFVKHPYDIGDRVDINDSKFVVLQMSLLYTVFRRIDNGKTSQVPNNVLNTQWIENVSRSKQMSETIKLDVDFSTTFEDIQALKEEMAKFVQENNRDYRPDFGIEVAGVNNMDKLELKIQILHKSNWANCDLTTQRRNKFICALVASIRKVPIYGPGGGSPIVGEEAKPMYTVAISNDLAQENMKKAADAKIKQRWDYESSDSNSDDDEKPSAKERAPPAWQVLHYEKETGMNSDSATAVGSSMNPRTRMTNISPLGNAAVTTGYDPYSLSHTDSKQSRTRSLRSNRSAKSRRQRIETAGGELQRGTTGRRKVRATVASPAINSTTSGALASNYPSNNQGFNNSYMQQQQVLAAAQVHSSLLPHPSPGKEVQYPQPTLATLEPQSQRPPLPLSPPFPGPQAQYLPQSPPPSGPPPP